ncbi:MAG: hypothetical protein NT069_26605 [Planctomycetota bacterium]|nr:hypothetical protein [Planctomycetota bacterium]
MKTVELDDRTAEQLTSLAAANGLTPADYLKLLFPPGNGEFRSGLTLDQLEGLLSELSFDGRSLPEDFSRADIYDDHD